MSHFKLKFLVVVICMIGTLQASHRRYPSSGGASRNNSGNAVAFTSTVYDRDIVRWKEIEDGLKELGEGLSGHAEINQALLKENDVQATKIKELTEKIEGLEQLANELCQQDTAQTLLLADLQNEISTRNQNSENPGRFSPTSPRSRVKGQAYSPDMYAMTLQNNNTVQLLEKKVARQQCVTLILIGVTSAYIGITTTLMALWRQQPG